MLLLQVEYPGKVYAKYLARLEKAGTQKENPDPVRHSIRQGVCFEQDQEKEMGNRSASGSSHNANTGALAETQR